MANGENKQNKTHKVILATMSPALHVPITTEENKKDKTHKDAMSIQN